jgi:ubiquinone/menaquinone biosynthesis C-methylase UbiE
MLNVESSKHVPIIVVSVPIWHARIGISLRLTSVARSMVNSTSPQIQLEKTYNAAADHYDCPALSFWDRFGRRTVDRLPLVQGMKVLDVCCGMGGSALPAAERIGPTGHVIAVDLAENLLAKGSMRAAERKLTNIEFRRADLEALPFADQTFDALICVFGIFFVPDLHGAVQELWRLVRPDGLLAITIWGSNTFEPADGIFWQAVRREDPELYKSIKPWSKIVEPGPLRTLLVDCGILDSKVVAEPGTHPIESAEDWWTIILGSGYRSTVDALSDQDRERVKITTIEGVRREKIREIRTDVVYAVARRPLLNVNVGNH